MKPAAKRFKRGCRESTTASSTSNASLWREFWDPSGQLSAELLALIKAVAAPRVDWSSVIPRVEQLGLKIENEVDQVHRDELKRYHGGGGGGDM